jgi:hypothetical protein
MIEYYSDFLIISATTDLLASHFSLPRKTGISGFAGYKMTCRRGGCQRMPTEINGT